MSKALPPDKLMRWVGAYHDLVSPRAQPVAEPGCPGSNGAPKAGVLVGR